MLNNYNLSEYRQMTKDEIMALNAVLLAITGGAGTAIYTLWRKLKESAQRDREIDAKHADDRATVSVWRNEVDRKDAEIERLKNRLEEVSDERNTAVQRLGSLEAHVEHLSEQVEALQAENRDLKAMVSAMAEVNNQVLDEIRRLKTKDGASNDGKVAE